MHHLVPYPAIDTIIINDKAVLNEGAQGKHDAFGQGDIYLRVRVESRENKVNLKIHVHLIIKLICKIIRWIRRIKQICTIIRWIYRSPVCKLALANLCYFTIISYPISIHPIFAKTSFT